MPRVSVTIPACNQAHYLAYALQSVVSQTYNDWEAIIVDDGSTDGTCSVVESFVDSRIRYIYQENQGLSAARNTGIRTARGEFLAFLDADDGWEREFLRRCTEILAADRTLAGVYGHTCFMDESGKVLPRIGGYPLPRDAFRQRILEGGFFPVHAALVRAEIVRAVGSFDEQLTSLEDWDLWIRVSSRHQMLGIAEPLVRYRLYPGSMSTDAARMHRNRIAVVTKHFGPPEGDPAVWPRQKRRAYGFADRSSALGYIQQGQPDKGWELLAGAVSVWPHLLQRLDTFYELACGEQAKGYRGQADRLDLERSEAEMAQRLGALLAEADAPARVKCTAYGNAYLALAMLADQAGKWEQARGYLVRALRFHPTFLGDATVARRFIKLCAGRRLVGGLRYLRSGGFQTLTTPSD